MDGHTLSIASLGNSSLADVTFDYAQLELLRAQGRTDDRGPFWGRSLVVGLNGASSLYYPSGYHRTWLEPASDGACAGVFILANSERGRIIAKDWFIGNASIDAAEWSRARCSGVSFCASWEASYSSYAMGHPWEQRMLNYRIVPAYDADMLLFSYYVINSPFSPFVRHLWSHLRTDFDIRLLADVMWLFGQQ
jgi:hypothetical protein